MRLNFLSEKDVNGVYKSMMVVPHAVPRQISRVAESGETLLLHLVPALAKESSVQSRNCLLAWVQIPSRKYFFRGIYEYQIKLSVQRKFSIFMNYAYLRLIFSDVSADQISVVQHRC